METQEAQPSSNRGGIELALETLLTYLERARQDLGNETTFAWDWEMLHEAVYMDKPTAVYSGVLWHGLRCLQDAAPNESDEGRIVITEGTRRELLGHLRTLLGDAQRGRRKVRDTLAASTGDDKYRGFSKRPDWKDVIDELRQVSRAESRLNRLLFLLENYARPAPVEPEAISQGSVELYQHQLDHFRPGRGAAERNVNDAFNLASVDMIQKGLDRGHVNLVTATGAVRRANAERTIDPIEFALRAEIVRQFPQLVHRRVALMEIMERLLQRLLNLGHDERRHSSSAPGMQRRDVPDFLLQITAMDQDPALCELARLLAKAQQAMENAKAQMAREDTVATELLTPELARFHSQSMEGRARTAVMKLFGGAGAAMSDLNLSIRETARYTDAVQCVLEDMRGTPLIEVEAAEESLALRWEADISLPTLAELLNEKGLDLGLTGKPRVAVRAAGFRGLRWADASPRGIVSCAAQLAGDHKIRVMVVAWGEATFWYSVADEYAQNQPLKAAQLARVAVRVPHGTPRALLADLYGRSALVWLFPEIVEELIGQAGRRRTTGVVQ